MPRTLDDSRTEVAARAVHEDAMALSGAPSDFDALLERVGDARFVLIGEASHGTHEFYRIRAEITKRLIREKGFTAVAVEADWPDAWRVNRYVRGDGLDADATESLAGFRRFPQWMWRNADVLDFVGWLKSFNAAHPSRDRRVGFYGLDLYSMHASMEAVLEYLEVVDRDAARRARERYACFDRFGDDPAVYGQAATLGLTASCEREVITQLLEMQQLAGEYARRDGRLAPDALFFAEQNARLVKNAERYYRSMFLGAERSWNLRDRHMSETLDALSGYLGRTGAARIVVWAHNSHLGDARETEMSRRGELNLGQLTRQASPDATVLVGFTTYQGTVTAASDWGGGAERKTVRPALPGSHEALLYQVPIPNFFLDFRRHARAGEALTPTRLERAIGVIYRPETERASHYFGASLARQFDAIFHYDVTRAVEPLERTGTWERGEFPETYPSAL